MPLARRRSPPPPLPPPRASHSAQLSARFHRAWSALPSARGLERDPDAAIANLRLLAGFLVLCASVFALPTALSALGPEAAAVPGTAPRVSEGASTLHGDAGAVAADVAACSRLGVRVLRDLRGNAVDAAVSVMLCQGVLAPFASGIGGGAFVLVHFAGNATMRRDTRFIDAREVAPAAVNPAVYTKNETASRLGGNAVAVPGELRGLHSAHRRWGQLPWADVVRPVVAIAEEALVGPMLARRLVQMNETIFKSPSLAAIFTREPRTAASLLGLGPLPDAAAKASPDPVAALLSPIRPVDVRAGATEPVGGSEDLGSPVASPEPVKAAPRVLLKEGDKLRNPRLVETLKNVAERGSDYIYNDVAPALAEEVQVAGGVLKHTDLRGYKVVVRKPIESYYQGLKVVGGPPPSAGGASIAMALNILEGLKLHRYGRNAQTYLKLVETVKYVFGLRSLLGDPAFVPGVTKILNRMMSKRVAMSVRASMDDGSGKTHDPEHYSPQGIVRAAQREDGTAHVSIVDKENNAVSVTSTINLPFGAGFVSEKTGIIFNNQMDDFSTAPDRPNAFGLLPSKENEIKPGKRPLSSMSPTIIMHNNLPYLVVGGSGGPRIITSTLQAIVNVVDWGDVLGDALSAPRIHHQLVPNVLWMESVQTERCELYRALKRPSGTAPGGSWSYWPSVCKAMKAANHNVSGPSLDGCVQAVQVVSGPRDNSGKSGGRRIYAASDPRKMGQAFAY